MNSEEIIKQMEERIDALKTRLDAIEPLVWEHNCYEGVV